jgi:hypothetical protein
MNDKKTIIIKSLANQHLFFDIDGQSQCLAPGKSMVVSEMTDQLNTMAAKKLIETVDPTEEKNTAVDTDVKTAVNTTVDAVNMGVSVAVDLSSLNLKELLEEAGKRPGLDTTGMTSKVVVREAIELFDCEKFAIDHEAGMGAFVSANNIPKPANLTDFKAVIERYKTEVLNTKN